jgi:hypothetical protein
MMPHPAHRAIRSQPRFSIGVMAGGLTLIAVLAGCRSPEDGRPRGGGPGADGGNYRDKPVHAPSKIDGTKDLPSPSKTR